MVYNSVSADRSSPSRDRRGVGPMLTKLATFIHANRRRVLLVVVLAAAIAGAFGFGVAKHMSPYGADDPATQSVKATNRFEAAAQRKVDPGIVVLVSAGE